MEIANRYANGEEEDRLRSGKGRANEPPGNASWKKKKLKGDTTDKAEVAGIPGQVRNKSKKKKEWAGKKKAESKSNLLDQPCPIHSHKDEEGETIPAKQTAHECCLLWTEMGGEPSGDKEDDGRPYGCLRVS
ncbi:hypothetical protein ZWY2020_041172 [Hordeum vulgare]|nr:hypothetical protein ZWY2020_041172 [Hordeum vulgare]